MAFFQFNNIKIAGMASAVPTRVVDTEAFVERFGEDVVKKFIDMAGVKQRHVANEKQTASDFGYAAAEYLLKEKQIDKESIGVLVFGSHCNDYRKPATAAVLQKRLGLNLECAAFDVGLGCSAFVYCIQIAASMLVSSTAKRALVIVGETPARYVNNNDRSQIMLGGDGGSAILLEKTEEAQFMAGGLYTDGSGYRAIIVPAGGFRNEHASHDEIIWEDGNPRTLYQTYMNGMDVFTFTMTKVPRSIKAFLKQTDQEADQFDCYAFHQANKLILQQLAKKLKVDFDKMPICMDRYGNTVSCSIPLLLSDAYGKAEGHRALNILMCGFGIGLSWGILSTVVDTEDILPIIETDECFSEGIINSPEDLL